MQNKINKLIEKSNQGDLDSILELGYCYANGDGVKQNHKEAIKWFEKVEKQGISIEKYNIVAQAQHNIASCILCILPENKENENENELENKLIEYIKKAAQNGYAQSQYTLGAFYENGIAVEKDYEKALKLYEQSASQNHADSNYKLGTIYENGYGVEVDYKKSIEFYEKAQFDEFYYIPSKYEESSKQKIKELSKKLGIEYKSKLIFFPKK